MSGPAPRSLELLKYATPKIPITINKHLYDLFIEHCEDNALVGIKGFISIENNELIIVATKVSLLSSKK